MISILQKLMGKGSKGGSILGKVDPFEKLSQLGPPSPFSTLARETIAEICAHMEMVPFSKGAQVIRQGDEGDYHYLLTEGAAQVTRCASATAKPVVLAELKPGASFGEEALISMAKRNATVTMTTDGQVLRLSKEHFNTLVKEPQLQWLFWPDAQALLAQGAKLIDVRPAEEFLRGSLPDAMSIPILDLRSRLKDLDKAAMHVCVCQNSRLSAAAAFLLKQNGFQAAVLRGGLQRIPGFSGKS